MPWIRRISSLVYTRSEMKGKSKGMKKFCVLFSLLMCTMVFTACGTAVKNSSDSNSNRDSGSKTIKDAEKVDLVDLGSEPQDYMLYGSYWN